MMPELAHPAQHEEERIMDRTVLRIDIHSVWCLVFAGFILLFLVCTGYSPAEGATKGLQQKTFRTPEEAAKALAGAMRPHDIRQISVVLGPHSRNIISSGDEVADRDVRERFIKYYDEKNRVEMVNDSRGTLYVGETDWPLPIPIVKRGKGWVFDTKAAKDEILNRRIGRNELAVIKVCEAYVDAQQEFSLMDNDGDGFIEYAQKFRSSPGKKDGLYWETKEGEQPSPLGPFAANAKKEGYLKQSSGDKPQPYFGYFYRVLKGQGENARGGPYDYVVNGNMIGGFALVAYPAKHGSTGIMTFIVNHDGVVYQKNLGKHTIRLAEAMKLFDPDKTWTKVEVK